MQTFVKAHLSSQFWLVMKPSLRACLLWSLFPLLLVSCGKEGYEISDGKVIWNSWQSDGLFGKWSESQVADAKGFTIIEPYHEPCPGYAKNTQYVFCGPWGLEGADVATFQVVDKWGALAKDAKQVYYRTDVIEGADPVTFEVVGGVGRDKADYYIGPAPLRVRDRASFKVLDEKVLGKDDHIWAHDKLDYYVGKQPTPIADSATFQVVQSWYAKDKMQVYFGSAILPMADPASFQGIGGESGEFAKDAKHVYCQGEVVEGCDAATFQFLQYRYAKDSRSAYFCYASSSPPLALPGSDAATFVVIGPSSQGFGYAKDAKQVYSGANVIPGADPATFVVDPSDPEKASDKHRHYHHGEAVE